MRIPRWATYPAIALLLVVAFVGLPQRSSREGAALRSRRAASWDPGQARSVAIEDSTQTATRTWSGETRSLLEFLPEEPATDGSVDYREAVQRAIDACAGATLELPDFPVLVGRAPGERHGLLVRRGLVITGGPRSELRTEERALQLLRAEDVEGLYLSGFAFAGPGGDGQGLAHGLLQITGGEEVHLRDLDLRDADCDGVAVSRVEGFSLEGLSIAGASKSAIVLSDCSDGFLRGNFVSDFGGHLDPEGRTIGVGIQLSSCREILCSENVVQSGLGVGILCNAFQGGPRPFANAIRDNHVSWVRNEAYQAVSGGIRLANGSGEAETRTHVDGNSIFDCGAHGIYVENHGASVVRGNLVCQSERFGILVNEIEGLEVTENVVLRGGATEDGEERGIVTSPEARGVRLADNVTEPETSAGSPE